MKCSVFAMNQWKNREPLNDYSAPAPSQRRALQASDVIYTLHIPSFTNGTNGFPRFISSRAGLGTYQSASQFVSYLANLGVTVVRIMSLEPAICFSSLIDSRCWKRRSNVYEGVQHPAYGSPEELVDLVQAIHQKGMLAMIDVDWSGLSRYSDFYDYDGSSIPTSFGPLFQATYDTYEYQSKTCKKFDLSRGSAGETIVSSALDRLATVFRFDGIYWRGLMCLRLDSSNCERGTGSDNAINTQYLIITKAYLEGVPKELEEAAIVDGANDFIIVSRIFVPVTKPIIATIALFNAVSIWNQYLIPQMFLHNSSLKTIQQVLANVIVGATESPFANTMVNGVWLNQENMKAAAIFLAMLPIVCIYPFVQKYFKKGILIGSVKG